MANKILAIAVVAGLVLALTGAAALYFLAPAVFNNFFSLGQSGGNGTANLPESSEFYPSLDDAALYKALADNGVEGAVVEIQENKVLVSLKVPQGADARKTAFLAIGAAGALAPPSSAISVEASGEGGTKTFLASAAQVQKFLEGKTTEQEFEKTVWEK